MVDSLTGDLVRKIEKSVAPGGLGARGFGAKLLVGDKRKKDEDEHNHEPLIVNESRGKSADYRGGPT